MTLAIAWLPWSADAFSRARDEQKPVLLSITTTWSQPCREMDRTSYADPAIACAITDGFVPVRVDADRRPDICERYTLGGWPTTAFLTPNGDILGGGTYIEPERMTDALARVRSVCVAEFTGEEKNGNLFSSSDTEQSSLLLPSSCDSAESLWRAIVSTVDVDHGGFGTAPKFPHTAPLHVALARLRHARDEQLESIVTRTLDAMGWGPLYDEIDGGFFRFSAARDWQQPHREKMLAVNAALLDVYVDAAETLKIPRFAGRAADVVEYVQRRLADTVDGGWFGSERSGDGHIDDVFYADANAAMTSAMLRAARLLDDRGLREFALKSLERVLLACYRPGHGVAHYYDGQSRVRALLVDQIAMAEAALDAFETTEDTPYEMMSEELAHYAVREMWDADAGGFFDRTVVDGGEAVGLMRVRLKPFVTNCRAARLLKRLAGTSGDSEFARLADATLAAAGTAAGEQGPLAAYYLLAGGRD